MKRREVVKLFHQTETVLMGITHIATKKTFQLSFYDEPDSINKIKIFRNDDII